MPISLKSIAEMNQRFTGRQERVRHQQTCLVVGPHGNSDTQGQVVSVRRDVRRCMRRSATRSVATAARVAAMKRMSAILMLPV